MDIKIGIKCTRDKKMSHNLTELTGANVLEERSDNKVIVTECRSSDGKLKVVGTFA